MLLKNKDGLLPLSGGESIAVIGAAGGAKPKASGGGSSGMIAPYVITPVDGIRKRVADHAQVAYDDGSDLARAAEVAKAAKVAIVFVNTDDSEGRDRPSLELPNHQDELVEAVAAANPNTIVVLNTGGPVLMPWIDKISGLIEAWYPGQEDGNAIAAVLYGDVESIRQATANFPSFGRRDTNEQRCAMAGSEWKFDLQRKARCRLSLVRRASGAAVISVRLWAVIYDV